MTPREVDILTLIAQGKSNLEIATELGMARQTVRNYASSIYYKFGVRSRTEALVKVWSQGRPNRGLEALE